MAKKVLEGDRAGLLRYVDAAGNVVAERLPRRPADVGRVLEVSALWGGRRLNHRRPRSAVAGMPAPAAVLEPEKPEKPAVKTEKAEKKPAKRVKKPVKVAKKAKKAKSSKKGKRR